MNRRGAGVVFFCIAAYLLSIRYILAFIYIAQFNINWPFALYVFVNRMKSLFGALAWIALAAGITYLVLAGLHKEK